MKKIPFFPLLIMLLGLASCNKASNQQENETQNSYSIDISFEGDDYDTMVMTIVSVKGPKDLDVKIKGELTYSYRGFFGDVSSKQITLWPDRKHAEKNMRLELKGFPPEAISGTLDMTVEFYRTKDQLGKDLMSEALSQGEHITANSVVDCQVEYLFSGPIPSYIMGNIIINGNK